MRFIDIIKRRKNVVYQESEGVNLAIYFINQFIQRQFFFKGLKNVYSDVRGDHLARLLQAEMDSALLLYRYRTKIKTYIDRKGVSQLNIWLFGRASMMDRYNPLDIVMCIKTEA
jgi:hypothetical protein